MTGSWAQWAGAELVLLLALFAPLPNCDPHCPDLFRLARSRADGDSTSYWASGPDPASRVDVQLDFGTTKQIKAVAVDWEHPAQVLDLRHVQWLRPLLIVICFLYQAFELQVASGGKWTTIFGTSGNNLQATSYVGPVVSGTALRIRMTQVPHFIDTLPIA